MKTIFLVILIAGGLIVGAWLFIKQPNPSSNSSSQCQIQEMTFYYLDTCGWCQKVKDEGTLDKLEKLGVKIKRINANIGPVRHQFQGVPTFVIDGKVYSGYKTFDELRELIGCPLKEENRAYFQIKTSSSSEIQFFGEKGENVNLENSEVKLAVSSFSGDQAWFYNVKMPASPAGGPDGKTIYFFVVKDKNGVYRAAANACQVCFKTYKGFRQEGDEIVCNNCGNRYPIEKIATEKGGCNPGPINPNLEIKNGQIIIKQADLEQVLDLF